MYAQTFVDVDADADAVAPKTGMSSAIATTAMTTSGDFMISPLRLR
jgi:hypothetical protein